MYTRPGRGLQINWSFRNVGREAYTDVEASYDDGADLEALEAKILKAVRSSQEEGA
jgi:hypothetical protein